MYYRDMIANLTAAVRIGGFVSFVPPMRWEHGNGAFEQNKFYYITKGRCSISIEGKNYTAKAGDWFFIPAGARHSYYNFPDEVLEKYWLHFDLYPDADFFKTMGLGNFVKVDDNNKIERMFSACTHKCRSGKVVDIIEAKSMLLGLLAEYVRLSKQGKPVLVNDKHDSLAPVLLYINDSLSTTIENSKLAELCHMNPRYFIKFFKEQIGETPQTYIMRLRMEKAKAFLEQGSLTNSEIAERLGLCDTAHLCKVFKKFYSMSQSQYRKILEEEARFLAAVEEDMKLRGKYKDGKFD